MHAWVHTHTHTPSWIRALTLFIVTTWEESKEQWKSQKKHLICRCPFLQKSRSLISVLNKPTPKHLCSDFLCQQANLSFSHWLKKESLLLPWALDHILRYSFPFHFWYSSLDSSVSPCHQHPFCSPFYDLTAMDQILLGSQCICKASFLIHTIKEWN